MRRFRGIILSNIEPNDPNMLWYYQDNLLYFDTGEWVPLLNSNIKNTNSIININNIIGDRPISLSDGIKIIPKQYRTTGLIITFLMEDGSWGLYQFQLTSLNIFENPDAWKNLSRGSSIDTPINGNWCPLNDESKIDLKYLNMWKIINL